MANDHHVEILGRGVERWNDWRRRNPGTRPDLGGAHLYRAELADADLSDATLAAANLADAHLEEANLSGADLSEAKLSRADLYLANLSEANLSLATLLNAYLVEAQLPGADLSGAHLSNAQLGGATLAGANLSGAWLDGVELVAANLTNAKLSAANLHQADLYEADLTEADMRRASLGRADLSRANLTGANLAGASLIGALLVETTVEATELSNAYVYGVSAWDLQGTPKGQHDLVITRHDEEHAITVDDLKVAQFVYLLLDNPNIRDVIDTIGAKGVLILGRFGDRKPVLDQLRTRLRELGFAPIVFDFEKPTTKTLTETVHVLAGLCAFVLADITDPESVPQEAMAVIPTSMVPFVPIIQAPQEPWAMLTALWQEHPDRVLEPLSYPSIDQLLPRLRRAVVEPALEQRKVLLARRAEEMGTRSLDDFAVDEQ